MQSGQLNLSCSLRSHSPQRNSRYKMLRLVAMIETSTITTRERSTFGKRKSVLIVLLVWLIVVSIQPSETFPQKTDCLRLCRLTREESSKTRMRTHVSSCFIVGTTTPKELDQFADQQATFCSKDLLRVNPPSFIGVSTDENHEPSHKTKFREWVWLRKLSFD